MRSTGNILSTDNKLQIWRIKERISDTYFIYKPDFTKLSPSPISSKILGHHTPTHPSIYTSNLEVLQSYS